MLSPLQNTSYHCGERRCEISVHLLHVSLWFYIYFGALDPHKGTGIPLSSSLVNVRKIRRQILSAMSNLARAKLLMTPRALPAMPRDLHITKLNFDIWSRIGFLNAIGHLPSSTMSRSGVSSKCCTRKLKRRQQPRFHEM